MSKVERLDKVLSNMGYGSRKEIKKALKDGLVKVNGKVISKNGVKVKPYEDEIYFNNNLVEYKEYIYLMMNKPDGYVSSTDDPVSETVLELLEYEHQIFNPFPAGRLDKDTEGFLLLTNDGKLAHNLLSPKKQIPKTYYAKVEGIVTEKTIEAFKKGVTLDDGYETAPADLEIVKSDVISEIYLTITEGKFHQVKRMFNTQDMEVVYLKRVNFAYMDLDDSLELGEYRELTDEEVEELKNL